LISGQKRNVLMRKTSRNSARPTM